MASNLLQMQINKIIDYLADKGKSIIRDAVATKDTLTRKRNQQDAYGWAVYFNGREMKRGYYTETRTAEKQRNGWKEKGIAPGYGRDDLESYFNQYKPKTNGFQLIVVNAVFYTEILEKGASHLTRKFMVITQEMANMENVAKQFKGANISLL